MTKFSYFLILIFLPITAIAEPAGPLHYLTKINISYPQFVRLKNPTIQKKLNQLLIKNAQTFAAPCLNINNADTMTLQEAKNARSMILNDNNSCTYSSKIILNNNAVISVLFEQQYHSLGEQGAARTYKAALNFDLIRGKVITLSDLFKPNYLTPLTTLANAALQQQKINNPYLTKAVVTPNLIQHCGFLLDKTALVLLFQPLQLASDAAGPITISIPYQQIRPIINYNVAGS